MSTASALPLSSAMEVENDVVVLHEHVHDRCCATGLGYQAQRPYELGVLAQQGGHTFASPASRAVRKS